MKSSCSNKAETHWVLQAGGTVFAMLFALVLTGCGNTQASTGSTSTSPGVVYAATSVACGGDHYQVSTGSSKGNCNVNTGTHGVESGGCSDGDNQANFSCKDGVFACNTQGSGSCVFVPSK